MSRLRILLVVLNLGFIVYIVNTYFNLAFYRGSIVAGLFSMQDIADDVSKLAGICFWLFFITIVNTMYILLHKKADIRKSSFEDILDQN